MFILYTEAFKHLPLSFNLHYSFQLFNLPVSSQKCQLLSHSWNCSLYMHDFDVSSCHNTTWTECISSSCRFNAWAANIEKKNKHNFCIENRFLCWLLQICGSHRQIKQQNQHETMVKAMGIFTVQHPCILVKELLANGWILADFAHAWINQ